MLTQQESLQSAWRHHTMTAHLPGPAGRSSRPTPLRRLIPGLLVTIILVSLTTGVPAPVSAQTDDGTGAAVPGPPSDCVIPRSSIDLTATPTPIPSPTLSPTATESIASPIAAGASPVASPVSDGATPVVSAEAPAAVVAPTVDPLTEELLSASTTITSCLTERNVETFTAITTATYRGQQFGSDEPISADVYAQLAPTLLALEYRIVELRDITVIDATTVTASVTYTVAYQQRTSVWTFTQDRVDGLLAWVLANEEAAPAQIPDGASALDVAIQDNAYAVSSQTTTGPNVVLNLTNADGVDHEALVLKLPIGTSSGVLLQNPGPALPDGVAFIGQSTVSASSNGVLLLTNLPPGIYTIVCLLPDEDGLPHLSSGMETTFTVN